MNAKLKSAQRATAIRRERIGPWSERLWLGDGREMLLRPIDPQDAEPLRHGLSLLTPYEVRMRFLHPITELTEAHAQQLCHVDAATGFVLVVAEPLPAGEALVAAVARLAFAPGRREAEFGLIVARLIARQGLGTLLLKRLINYARRRRLDAVVGDVLEENWAMLDVCDRLGFSRHPVPDEPGIVRVRLALRRA